MADTVRVILEIGKKRKVVAAAADWPGLDRSANSEPAAIEKLVTYLPRYEPVAARAGLAAEFTRSREPEVLERTPGSSSTDFFGIAHVPSRFEHEPMPDAELERRLMLLQATWAHFDAVAGRVSTELRPNARGSGGRSRDQIVRHVYGSEADQFGPKVEIRTPLEEVLTPDGLTTHRAQFLDAVRAYHADGRMARKWPLRFLIRRAAQHLLDHAWELEDRDLTPKA